MTITERVAYIRGLLEGMEINVDKKEGRILKEMLELLEDIALSVTDLEEENDAMQDVLDTMIEDIYDDDDSYDEDDEDDEEDELDFDPDSDMYEIVCPSCGEEIYVDEATLSQGAIGCPACGEELEFDLSSLEDAEDVVIGVDAEPVSEDEDEFDDD